MGKIAAEDIMTLKLYMDNVQRIVSWLEQETAREQDNLQRISTENVLRKVMKAKGSLQKRNAAYALEELERLQSRLSSDGEASPFVICKVSELVEELQTFQRNNPTLQAPDELNQVRKLKAVLPDLQSFQKSILRHIEPQERFACFGTSYLNENARAKTISKNLKSSEFSRIAMRDQEKP